MSRAAALLFCMLFAAPAGVCADGLGDLLPESDAAYLAPGTKSPNRAFLYSALLPGAGQLYADADRGFLYLAAEAALLTGYVVVRRSAQQTRDDYFNLVRAGVTFDGQGSTDTWNEEDFEHATDFNTWENIYVNDGGTPIARVGAYEWRDLSGAGSDSQLRQEALEKRLDSNSRFRDARTLLGALLFNHLISAVDARFAARSSGSSISARLRPDGSPALTFRASF